VPTPDRDRFDDVPRAEGRVGAHRAENPGMNGWVVLLWSAVAALVLTAGGIFAVMIATDRVSLGPQPTSTGPAPSSSAPPQIDTSYGVMVLNATGQDGLAGRLRDTIVKAGWPEASVLAGDADSHDFAETTVYYQNEGDQPAAAALAALIGGAKTVQSSTYGNDVGEGMKQLTVVIGLDHVSEDAPSPSETPAAGSDG